MNRYFVDSNVFLRFFTKDDPKQHERAHRLIKKAEAGGVELVTGPPVFFEVAWVLRSAHKVSNEEISRRLNSILGMRGLEVIDRDVADSALKLSEETGVAYSDAYISVSSAEIGADAVATFNIKDFKRAGVKILEME